MAGTGRNLDSLRLNRVEGERFLLALTISIFAHVLIWGGYELNREIRLLPRLPSWLAVKQLPRLQPQEEPLEFVTVETPSAEAPEKAKYVSNKNSVAANPEATRDTDQPKLNGKQTDVPATETVVRFSKGQSEAETQANHAQPQPAVEPKPSETAGDLTLGKPGNAAQQDMPRPRTLKEAYAEMAKRMPSLTMREEGGVSRRAGVPSFDVKVTGFGDYDERFVEAVTQNWYDLLDSQRFSLDRTGKVVLYFRLNSDGTITETRIGENEVGDLLGYVCEKALIEGAPYERWTEDMRLKLGDHYNVQFTFYY